MKFAHITDEGATAKGTRAALIESGCPAAWFEGVLRRPNQRWGKKCLIDLETGLSGVTVHLNWSPGSDSATIRFHPHGGHGMRKRAPQWLLEIEKLTRAAMPEPADVPIDDSLMIRTMLDSAEQWATRGRAFARFMIRAVAEPVPKEQPFREGPRRPDSAPA